MTARAFTAKEDGVDINHASHINALQTAVTALSVITVDGDLITGDSTGVETRLGKGSDNKVLGVDSSVSPAIGWYTPRPLLSERQMQVLTNAGATTLTTLGFTAAPTASGTPTNVDDADGPLINYQSGAVSGNVGGLNSAATVCRRDWQPTFFARIKTPATITLNRFWIGLFSGAPTASATPAVHLAGFRYDTTADGTAFWRLATDDSGGAPTLTTTTVAVAADTVYDMAIRLISSGVKFWINNTYLGQHTTDLPTSTTMLSWYVTVTTLTGAARNIKISRVALVHE